MNSPSKPPLSEDPAKQLVSHASEETPIQPSPTSDSLSEETNLQPTLTPEPVDEETELQSDVPAEPVDEETEQQLVPSTEPVDEEDIPTQTALSSEPLTEEAEQQSVSSEPLAEDEGSAPENVEVFDLDEDEDELSDSARPGSALFQPMQSGLFIHTKALIAAACALVLIALVVAVLVFVARPKDPPTDWIASYVAPGSSVSTKTLYYLHWTNQNGNLTGQLQLAANPSGTPQALTAPATGLYNRDNHIIYVVVIVQGQPDTLTGKINDSNDTMTLNLAGATSSDGQLVFHLGNANDYKTATQQLGPKKK